MLARVINTSTASCLSPVPATQDAGSIPVRFNAESIGVSSAEIPCPVVCCCRTFSLQQNCEEGASMPDVTLDTKAVLLDELYRICDSAPLPSVHYTAEQSAAINEAFRRVLDLVEPYAGQQ